jgi:hypothetical protein
MTTPRKLHLQDACILVRQYSGRFSLEITGWRARRGGEDELVEVLVEDISLPQMITLLATIGARLRDVERSLRAAVDAVGQGWSRDG